MCLGSGRFHNWGTTMPCPRCSPQATVGRARAAVEARDARELRGEAVDWTRPVDGWTLFAPVTP